MRAFLSFCLFTFRNPTTASAQLHCTYIKKNKDANWYAAIYVTKSLASGIKTRAIFESFSPRNVGPTRILVLVKVGLEYQVRWHVCKINISQFGSWLGMATNNKVKG